MKIFRIIVKKYMTDMERKRKYLHKYLLIDTSSQYRVDTNDHFYKQSYTFPTKAEYMKFLDGDVAENKRKYWVIYKILDSVDTIN